jgi:sec-independent protein translocase protein TatA
MNTLAFGLQSLGTWDMLVILLIALLIFGKRLPEVGKSLGKGIVEFKKGLKGIDEEVEQRSNYNPPRQELPPQQPAYRAPLTDASGEDRRVSRADSCEPAPHGTTPPAQG